MGKINQMKENAAAWLFLFPSLIFLVMFTLYPIIKTLIMSLFQSDLSTADPVYIGSGNFKMMWEDEVFRKAFINNLLFALGTVPTSVLIGMGLAVLVNRTMAGSGLARTFFFYPVVIPMVTAAFIWLFFYTPEYGMINSLFKFFGAGEMNLLGNSNTALIAIMVMVIWKEAGFFMIFYLAALQNIPKELLEASYMDGASKWIQFRKIIFPLLMPTTLFSFVIATTNAFKTVDQLVVMTQGGPNNASNLLLYYIYESTFRFLDYGKASAATVVVLILMLVIASIQFFGADRKIHYS
ncbi:MAG TPA: sugar ABC transporter permease [Bacillus bacterium]|uniref:ABC transporter permease n=2 Tax=Siminovitchia fordii TaxID=254759 RepID=A0ABQ4K154_9BACI|nr:sugar ABC transporter permease [Siminovitchia fordii]GIN19489.1 ABC transporter permease [Siminovitchia fordii]HBZ11641.1 sugar ABC transporter permease [Bacillus sp. (in: firmicutes)]